MNIYAGNLSRELTEQELREAFQAFGQVTSVKIIRDRYTNISKGFGFVEMPVQSEAQAALAGLDGKQLRGRSISVSEALPRKQRQPGQTQSSPWNRDRHGRNYGGVRRTDSDWRYRYLS